MVVAGLSLAAVGFAGRYVLRAMPQMSQKVAEAMKSLPKFDAESMATSKYYKGGFDQKMNKREAALILGVSPTASKNKVICFIFAYIVWSSLELNTVFPFTDQRRS